MKDFGKAVVVPHEEAYFHVLSRGNEGRGVLLNERTVTVRPKRGGRKVRFDIEELNKYIDSI